MQKPIVNSGRAEPMQTGRKIGLLSCMFMCIGGTIGVSIFGTLPEEARKIGPGVVAALALAAMVTVFRYFSRMYTCAALPINASTIMHGTKLIHPLVGGFLSINALLQPVLLSLFGIMFATYFTELFPQLPVSPAAVSAGLLLVFAVITYFGSRMSARVSNIIVILLLLVLGSYIALGWPHIDPDNISFMQIIRPGVGLTGIGASVGVLSSSLSGASTAAEIADEIKNSARNVPLVLVLCPVIVAALYIMLAIVTVGVVPYSELTTLAQVAEHFMSPSLVTLFIVGGPVCGVLTARLLIIMSRLAVTRFTFLPAFPRATSRPTLWPLSSARKTTESIRGRKRGSARRMPRRLPGRPSAGPTTPGRRLSRRSTACFPPCRLNRGSPARDGWLPPWRYWRVYSFCWRGPSWASWAAGSCR